MTNARYELQVSNSGAGRKRDLQYAKGVDAFPRHALG